MKEIYLAVKKVLSELKHPDNSREQLFKTIKVDKGQFQRLISNVQNDEMGIVFPAVFIHFVNVSYLTSQDHIYEGSGTMRVRFILNRLNDQEDEFETEIFDYAAIVNAAIQDGRITEAVLGKRCNLQYFDMPESMDNALQPCWIDYSVSFQDQSGYIFRDYIQKHIATPAFTNFSDMTEEARDGREDVEKDITTQSEFTDTVEE